MTEKELQKLADALEHVKRFFTMLMEDERLLLIESYTESNGELNAEFKVKGMIDFNGNTYFGERYLLFMEGDIIRVRCNYEEPEDEDMEGFYVAIEKIGEIRNEQQEDLTFIDFNKSQFG